MRFLSFLYMRAKRVFICMKRAVPKTLALEAAAMLILFTFSFFYFKDGAVTYAELLESAVLLLLVMWIICFAEQLSRYSFNLFHRFGDDIIGKAFTGLNRKSVLFEKGLELFHQNSFRLALEIFTELDGEKYDKTQQEQGVLSFFRGRCYDILCAYPNALICYEKALENGFTYNGMPLLIARMNVENGDTQRAVDIYTEILESGSENEYKSVIRTSLGHIYLNRGENETALKWFQEAVGLHENYAEALAGAAIAQLTLHNFEEAERLFQLALVNNIENSEDFSSYYKNLRKNLSESDAD